MTKKEFKKVLVNFAKEIEDILDEGLEFDNSIERDNAEAFLNNLQVEIWKKGIAPLLWAEMVPFWRKKLEERHLNLKPALISYPPTGGEILSWIEVFVK